MAILPDNIRSQVKKQFEENLKKPVRIVYFTQELECQFCKDTHNLLSEISSLSDKITLDVKDFVADKEQVTKYNIDKIPATVIMDDVDYGIRLYGIPGGYEFTSLIGDILMISGGEKKLSPKSLKRIATLKKPIHIKVFVTNT